MAVEEAASIELELEDARRDLRDTLKEINHRIETVVENVEENLYPDHIIKSHILAAVGGAVVLGFVAGGGGRTPWLEWLAIGGLIASTIGTPTNNGDGSSDAKVE
jgi:hypothetical protein